MYTLSSVTKCALILFSILITLTSEEKSDLGDIKTQNFKLGHLIENSTENYDFQESNKEVEDCADHSPTFMDKFRKLHEQGRNVSVSRHVNDIDETMASLETMKRNMATLFLPGRETRDNQKFIEFLSEIDLGLSRECLWSVNNVVNGVNKGELWAIQFLDSAGSLMSEGLTLGKYASFGDYDECLDIISPALENIHVTEGQYCLAHVVLPFPPKESYVENKTQDFEQMFSSKLLEHYGLTKFYSTKLLIDLLNFSNGTLFTMGICIPSQCSSKEFETFLNALLFPITRIPVEIRPECHVRGERRPLNKYQVISIGVLFVLLCLVILGTIYDILQRNRNKQSSNIYDSQTQIIDKLFSSFSIINNTSFLFTKNTKFASLDTIKLLVILNVHLGHFYYSAWYSISNKKYLTLALPKSFDNRYIFIRNPLIMDTFFTISGLLLSFTISRKLDKTSGRFNHLNFIFQRWIRFVVLMFGSIPFFFLFPLTGDGPIWDIGVGLITSGCQKQSILLKMLLLVHNLFDLNGDLITNSNACNAPSWFIATLFQLTLIGPIFIIIYYRKRLHGLIALLCIIILSVFASISPSLIFNVKPFYQVWEFESMIVEYPESFTWWHTMPFTYCTAFFIGICYGILLRKSIEISPLLSWLFSVLSLVFCALIYYWNNNFILLGQTPPLLHIFLWYSLGKLVFNIGLGWLLFALCTGRAGIFGKILSWQGFQPIARLSFGIFILHQLVFSHRVYSVHYTYVPSDKYILEHFVVDVIYDIILSYIFYILIEKPFSNVLYHFLQREIKLMDNSARQKTDTIHPCVINDTYKESPITFNVTKETILKL